MSASIANSAAPRESRTARSRASYYAGLCPAAKTDRWVVDRREPGERQRALHQSEVAQRDVVEARVGEQVDDDPREPCRDDIGPVARLQRDEHAGDDLGHAD